MTLTATASYDATRRVPVCATVAAGCDTGALVNGRGPMGPESNAPNTQLPLLQHPGVVHVRRVRRDDVVFAVQ